MNENAIYELHSGIMSGNLLKFSMFVYEDRVTIRTRYTPGILLTILTLGLVKFLTLHNGDVTTYISGMTSVIFKKADSTYGKIGFSVPGMQNESTGTVMYFRAESNDAAEKNRSFS